jgi:hypothetical protein
VAPVPVFRLPLAFEMGEVTVVAMIFGRPLLVPVIFAVIPIVVDPCDSCRSTASGSFRPDPDVCHPDGDRPDNWCQLTSRRVRSEPCPAEMSLPKGITASAPP